MKLCPSYLPRHIEIDEETFKIMWELSAPGGEAEGCFLRLQQKDYFYDGRDPHLEWMPDVSVHKYIDACLPWLTFSCSTQRLPPTL